jgi:hypothetical protein
LEVVNKAFSKFYSAFEYLVVEKVIIPFKGKVVFKQYLPKKPKHLGIKIYKLCDSTGYMCGMKVYHRKGRQHKVQDVCVTQNLIGEQKDEVANCIWIIFSPLLLFDDMTKKKKTSRKGKLQELGHKKMKVEQNDIQV